MADRYDVTIIGGGLAGLIHLHYANQAGLNAIVLERAPAVGGLWRTLPAWQDIQICPVDWTLGDLPMAGPYQPQVLANIESWVERFQLLPRIRLNSPVTRARHADGLWQVETPAGVFQAKHLISATGGQNRPLVPNVRREDPMVQEWHSSALREPGVLRGKDIVVVGGGASALDLLDLCMEHEASRVMWVHRGLRWFTPTQKSKSVAGSFRPYGKMQASGLPVEKQNALIGADLHSRYAKFGIEAILPDAPIDMRKDQLIPGRARMLQGFTLIERHPGTVASIERRHLVLADGTRLATDAVLWGTGYATDLSFFEHPEIAAIQSVHALMARCACIFRSLDAPNLYFPAVGLEGVGATSLSSALYARSIMSHIQGKAMLDDTPVPHKLNHLDMVRHLAARDPASFAAAGGWEHYRDLTLRISDDQAFPMP